MSDPSFVAAAREVVASKQHTKHEGILIDGWTAQAIVNVYDALSPENQAKVANVGLAPFAGFALGYAGNV